MTGDGVCIACLLIAELLRRPTLTGRPSLNLQASGDAIEQFLGFKSRASITIERSTKTSGIYIDPPHNEGIPPKGPSPHQYEFQP